MSLIRLGGLALLLCVTSHCSKDESSGGSSGAGGTVAGSGGAAGAAGAAGTATGGSTGGSAGGAATGGGSGGSVPVGFTTCKDGGDPWSWCGDGHWCAKETNVCIPTTWSCSFWEYGDAICSCSCGMPDPACADPYALVTGCAPGRACSPTGACTGVPAAWTCEPTTYAAKDGCDCMCGVVDADCIPGGPAKGCASGESCSPAGACVKPTAPAPVVTIDDYPKFDGATATRPLAMIIAAELFGIAWGWGYLGESSERGVWLMPSTPVEDALALKINQKITTSKTHESYLYLIDGVADLILVASKPSSEELAYAATKGVTLDVKVIARDALVFLVNAKNPVMGLSVEQIKGIYTKTITDWSQVGGSASTINPYTRPGQSGSQQLMEELVLKGTPMGTFPDWLQASFMGSMLDKLRTDPLAIGYSVYYFVTYQYTGSGARLLKINGVWPNYDTLSKQSYPLTSETLVVTRSTLDPTSKTAQMRAWLLAPEGQAVVKKSGYVPVNL